MDKFVDLSQWVIVFDIDDTLISEFQYRTSGLNAVQSLLSKTHNKDFYGKIIEYINAGGEDYMGEICKEFNFSECFKESLIWTYRLHYPNINFEEGVKELIDTLRLHKVTLAILSDGRSITQRLKLKAIGLNDIPAFISEEFDSDKFCNKRFIEIENLWPNKKYAYVGDNPKKDFFVTCDLGWLSFGADWVENKVHTYSNEDLVQLPEYIVKKPMDIMELLIRKNEEKLNNF